MAKRVPRRVKVLRTVVVRWKDACIYRPYMGQKVTEDEKYQGEWFSIGPTLKRAGLINVTTRGGLVKEDKKALYIVGTLDDEGKGLYIHVIPKVSVISIRTLKRF